MKKRIFLSGKDSYITICLKQKYDLQGITEDISDDTVLANTDVVLKGFTENRLQEIESYDYNNKYVVGVKGVVSVSDTNIVYEINGITYDTDRKTLVTSYTTTFTRQEQKDIRTLGDEFKNYFSSIEVMDDKVKIERQNISIIESVSRLRQIATVDEINSFGNKYYYVSNQ